MGAETHAISTPADIQHVYFAGKLETLVPGKLSMLVDIVPNINITGITAAREFDQQSWTHVEGHESGRADLCQRSWQRRSYMADYGGVHNRA
eukprot:3664982-Pyramimonas_sp.AAC.1